MFGSVPDLRRLRYFMAVADAASFRRAAERLGMAQPPLSQQIMALEDQLGQRLFIRHARTIELTDAGRALRDLTGPLLTAAAAIPARVDRAARGREGALCIGFTPGVAFHPLLPAALRAFRTDAPKIDLVFEEGDSISLCGLVADGKVQLAVIRPSALVRDGLHVENLLDEPVVAAVPRTHRLAKALHASLADFKDDDIILFERSLAPAIYDSILAACAQAGFSPRIVHHASQKTSAMILAAGGAGVTFAPASLCSVHAGSLRLLRLDGPQPTAALAIATRAGAKGVLAAKFRHTILMQAESIKGAAPLDAMTSSARSALSRDIGG